MHPNDLEPIELPFVLESQYFLIEADCLIDNLDGQSQNPPRPMDPPWLGLPAMAAGRTNDSALELYASPLLDLATTPSVSYFRDLLAVTSELPPFSSISAPVLALLSKHSTFTDPPATRRALEAFPDGELVELEARHWIPTEQAAAMREAMEGWIARRFPKP